MCYCMTSSPDSNQVWLDSQFLPAWQSWETIIMVLFLNSVHTEIRPVYLKKTIHAWSAGVSACSEFCKDSQHVQGLLTLAFGPAWLAPGLLVSISSFSLTHSWLPLLWALGSCWAAGSVLLGLQSGFLPCSEWGGRSVPAQPCPYSPSPKPAVAPGTPYALIYWLSTSTSTQMD